MSHEEQQKEQDIAFPSLGELPLELVFSIFRYLPTRELAKGNFGLTGQQAHSAFAIAQLVSIFWKELVTSG